MKAWKWLGICALAGVWHVMEQGDSREAVKVWKFAVMAVFGWGAWLESQGKNWNRVVFAVLIAATFNQFLPVRIWVNGFWQAACVIAVVPLALDLLKWIKGNALFEWLYRERRFIAGSMVGLGVLAGAFWVIREQTKEDVEYLKQYSPGSGDERKLWAREREIHRSILDMEEDMEFEAAQMRARLDREERFIDPGPDHWFQDGGALSPSGSNDRGQ